MSLEELNFLFSKNAVTREKNKHLHAFVLRSLYILLRIGTIPNRKTVVRETGTTMLAESIQRDMNNVKLGYLNLNITQQHPHVGLRSPEIAVAKLLDVSPCFSNNVQCKPLRSRHQVTLDAVDSLHQWYASCCCYIEQLLSGGYNFWR